MENELLRMKRYALAHGLCGRYTKRWDEAVSPKDLIDLASDANGLAFLAEGFAYGWCPSEGYVMEVFGDYINGDYISRHGGYTSEIWCGDRDGEDVRIYATAALVAHCSMSIWIPEFDVKRMYVTGNTDLDIDCGGVAYVSVYGDSVKLRTSGSGTVKVTYVTERKFV